MECLQERRSTLAGHMTWGWSLNPGDLTFHMTAPGQCHLTPIQSKLIVTNHRRVFEQLNCSQTFIHRSTVVFFCQNVWMITIKIIIIIIKNKKSKWELFPFLANKSSVSSGGQKSEWAAWFGTVTLEKVQHDSHDSGMNLKLEVFFFWTKCHLNTVHFQMWDNF